MEDVDRFAEILLSPEDIPPMDIYETACYFAFEAELYKHIIPAQFNLKYVMALRGNLARILQGKEVEGLLPNKPQNAPPLPNFTAAFEIALPQQIYARIIACEHEYKNTFGTFSRNLRRVYGRVGGWCQPYYGHHPKEKYPPRKDWGKELLIKQTELAILTTHCKDKLRLLIETLGIYGGICGSYGATNLFFKPQQLKLNPLTKQERRRRYPAEKKRHEEAMKRIRAQEEWEASQRNNGNFGGAQDEFDEAFGAHEFGNSYSYAWYTDRDSYDEDLKP